MADELWVRWVYPTTLGRILNMGSREVAQRSINDVATKHDAPLYLEVLNTGERFYPETPRKGTRLPGQIVEGTDGLGNKTYHRVVGTTEMGIVIEAATVEPPKPAPERVGAVAKRVREASAQYVNGSDSDASVCMKPSDARRLLACAEASDEYEAQPRIPGTGVRLISEAWRRTVTGETT